MRRSLPILASLLLLQGCYDDLSDIQQFMSSVKASTPANTAVAGSEAVCAY
jgi:hypothetical protein